MVKCDDSGMQMLNSDSDHNNDNKRTKKNEIVAVDIDEGCGLSFTHSTTLQERETLNN